MRLCTVGKMNLNEPVKRRAENKREILRERPRRNIAEMRRKHGFVHKLRS